jgi:NAD(P)-dependent dehydrogenase (short-subunit alcohol dehydrogenase family)
MAVNVRGVFLCIKHQVPLMLETAGNDGSIVITSSTAGVLLQQQQTQSGSCVEPAQPVLHSGH